MSNTQQQPHRTSATLLSNGAENNARPTNGHTPLTPDIQAERMDALTRFASGIAHALNNLIQGIMTSAEFARENPDTAAGDIDDIRKTCLRAADFTRQLQAFSRRIAIRPRTLDLNMVVTEQQPILERVLGPGISLHITPGRERLGVHFDPAHLNHVLTLLCLQARDALPNGGSIHVNVAKTHLTASYCKRHPWARKGEFALVGVTDDGPALSPEVLDRVFEPFAVTRDVQNAGSLSLSAVFGIIRQHGGLLDVSSRPDTGTQFRVYLPMVPAEPESKGAVSAEPRDTVGSETILVAEDDDRVRSAVQRILTSGGYQVITVIDGTDALKQLEKQADGINLAMLDVVMPGLNGKQVYEVIRARYPKIKVLFSTGYSADVLHTGFVLDAGLRLIEKPYSRMDLLREVREILDAPAPSPKS